jgi:hypothetical protein
MKKILFAFTCVSILLACNNTAQQKPKKVEQVSQNSQESEIEKKEILALEDSLAKMGPVPGSDNVNRLLMHKSIQFADKYPDNEYSADYLFMAARSANGLKQYHKSIKLLNQVIAEYDHYDRLVEVYFLKAFTYDEDRTKNPKPKKPTRI